LRSLATPRPLWRRPRPRWAGPARVRARRAALVTTPVVVLAALATVLSAAPATARPAAAPPETVGADDGVATTLGGFVDNLIKHLDELGAFDGAQAQSASSSGSTSKVTLAETWTARIAKLDAADRQVKVPSACLWGIKTRFQATYDARGQALQHVTAQPGATLSCGGTEGLPVRQVGTLSHRLNGTTDAVIGTRRCSDANGCPNADVVGPYRCDGAACAGDHQLVLRHTWTLADPYVWRDAPAQCRVRDRGRTLSCMSQTKIVTIRATRGGITISSPPAA
jgi:hypothetical protein